LERASRPLSRTLHRLQGHRYVCVLEEAVPLRVRGSNLLNKRRSTSPTCQHRTITLILPRPSANPYHRFLTQLKS